MKPRELRYYRAMANDVINGLDPHSLDDPVKWTDLQCTESRHVINDNGDEWVQLVIEEAAPDSQELQTAILAGFRRKGVGVELEILTEW